MTPLCVACVVCVVPLTTWGTCSVPCLSVQERGRRRALEGLHRHMTRKLPQYEATVAGLQAVVATLPAGGGGDSDATSLDVLVEPTGLSWAREWTSVQQLRGIIPK